MSIETTGPAYQDHELLRDARLRYWRENGFGDDGGYNKKWEIVKLGPIPLPIRNVESRKDAIRFHDLNHVCTGYSTDLRGEAEIAAWEVASGCGTKWVAWLLNLQALLMTPLWPGPVLRAWARGRRSKSLYAQPFDEALLDGTVGELRARLEIPAIPPEPNAVDRITLLLCVTASATAHVALLYAAIRGLIWVSGQLL